VKRYAFCPVCGSPLDRSPGGAARVSRLFCGSCKFEFWQNSKPAVGAFIVRKVGGKPHVLLTRRGIEPYRGMWDLPGGFLNNGEHPEEGLLRELREELGTAPSWQRFLTAEIEEYPREDVAEEARFVLSLFYLCEIAADAVLTPMDDVAAAEWFPLEELPDGIAFSANHRAFKALRKALESD
jgi:ADP-ribose pyrophosphatase YjhB (NUDIX family)